MGDWEVIADAPNSASAAADSAGARVDVAGFAGLVIGRHHAVVDALCAEFCVELAIEDDCTAVILPAPHLGRPDVNGAKAVVERIVADGRLDRKALRAAKRARRHFNAEVRRSAAPFDSSASWFASLTLLALLALPCAAAQQTELKVFLLAGQSNSEGHAEVASRNRTTGDFLNGTLAYQLRDPRTAAQFAPLWDNSTGNWTVLSDASEYASTTFLRTAPDPGSPSRNRPLPFSFPSPSLVLSEIWFN
jgi:hypothetical protein